MTLPLDLDLPSSLGEEVSAAARSQGEGRFAAAGAIVITAYGKPITQGSKVKGRWSTYDDNYKTLYPWRNTVQIAATEAMAGHERLTGPVQVVWRAYLERPQSHYGTGRNSHLLKATAPRFPIAAKTGDIDKLERALLDAMKDAGVYVDDVQVVHADGWKLYTTEPDGLDRPGVIIEVTPVLG